MFCKKIFQIKPTSTSSMGGKNFMAPFYEWGSTPSRLQSHYEETAYFLPVSPQKFLVHHTKIDLWHLLWIFLLVISEAITKNAKESSCFSRLSKVCWEPSQISKMELHLRSLTGFRMLFYLPHYKTSKMY